MESNLKSDQHDLILILANHGLVPFHRLRREARSIGVKTLPRFRAAFVALRDSGRIERCGRRRFNWRINPSALVDPLK